ncbi:hypothetical protein [Streptomyces sp. NPDC001307]|uniref:hypothetical protein n=1 Tax=Streptomyces sp. NPDC001307 TaxID=3364560 RepID=UPI0036A9A508
MRGGRVVRHHVEEDGLAAAHAFAPSGEGGRLPGPADRVPLSGRNPSLRPLVFGQITRIAELAELAVDP